MLVLFCSIVLYSFALVGIAPTNNKFVFINQEHNCDIRLITYFYTFPTD